MSLNKRIRKKPVGKFSNQKEYPKITMEQPIDVVISGKSAEGLRERTWFDSEGVPKTLCLLSHQQSRGLFLFVYTTQWEH